MQPSAIPGSQGSILVSVSSRRLAPPPHVQLSLSYFTPLVGREVWGGVPRFASSGGMSSSSFRRAMDPWGLARSPFQGGRPRIGKSVTGRGVELLLTRHSGSFGGGGRRAGLSTFAISVMEGRGGLPVKGEKERSLPSSPPLLGHSSRPPGSPTKNLPRTHPAGLCGLFKGDLPPPFCVQAILAC